MGNEGLFETRAYKGKLLVCGYDLTSKWGKRPVARQMLRSLLSYMNSDAFKPAHELDDKLLAQLLKGIPKAKVIKQTEDRFNDAALDVILAAGLKKMNTDVPWHRDNDQARVVKKGYDWQLIQGQTWKDNQGAAWWGNPLKFTLKVPQAVQGKLYVHFHDWNNNGRLGTILFEGREYELGKHDGAGQWVELTVLREETQDQKLELQAKAKSGPNLMITRIVFVPEG